MRKSNYEYGLTYRIKNKEKIKERKKKYNNRTAELARLKRKNFPDLVRSKEKEYHTRNKASYMIKIVKRGAKKRGIIFDISKDAISNFGTHCPALGIEYIFDATHSNKQFSPSIDRIDNNKGYTKDNVHVISCRANTLKSDATIDEIEKIVNYLRSQKLKTIT